MKTKLIKGILPALIAIACIFASGCASLDPNARAVVVRAEQSIAVANSTMNAVVHIDNANRKFFETNAPGFHQFCEWLRAPVIIPPLTNDTPRGIALVKSADAVKNAYKKSNAPGDYADLVSALAAIEAATAQAQGWLISQQGVAPTAY